MTTIDRTRDTKFNERRAELGEAALVTLAELGYARTSLREIAQNSQFTHGVLHYYFTDKLDLILCSVRQYKARCVKRYDTVTTTSTKAVDLVEGFAAALGDTLRNEASLHRLWYDLRAQSLFEAAFRADVAEIDKSLENMIWRVMSRYAELSGTPIGASSSATYAMFDGLFQQALLRHLSGDKKAVAALQADVRDLVAVLGASGVSGTSGANGTIGANGTSGVNGAATARSARPKRLAAGSAVAATKVGRRGRTTKPTAKSEH